MDNLTKPFNATFNIQSPVLTMSFNDAADYTAKLIADKYDNLHLCFSGGLDSEYVALVLRRNKIPFTPIILLTPEHPELWYAFKFCKEHNLQPLILDFSDKHAGPFYIDKLLHNVYEIATELKLPIVESLIPNVIARLLPKNTNIVTGYGEPLRQSTKFSDPIGDIFEIWDRDCYLNLEYGDRKPGAFFTYTPEIVKAIATDIDITQNSQLAKSTLYGLLPRSKMYSVFHYIKDSIGHKHPALGEVNKKFARNENLKYVSFSRQQLLDML